MDPMNIEVRPNSRVGEGMQILHVARQGSNVMLAVWGGEMREIGPGGEETVLEGFFGTVKLSFSTEGLAHRAEDVAQAWRAADRRLIVRYEPLATNGYASVTDPESGIRIACGEPA